MCPGVGRAGGERVAGAAARTPPEHVRRPNGPPESLTLGLSHLQLEALLPTARASANPNDFALMAMLGLRIFEATRADIGDLGEEHGHRVLRVVGKGTRVVLLPLPPAVGRTIERVIGDRTVPDARIGRMVAADAPAPASPHLRHHRFRRRSRPAECTDRRPAHRPTLDDEV